MWLECRFSALIRGVLHKYHSNCLGYILFLFTVPRFHRLKIHWTPGHDFNYKDSFLYLQNLCSHWLPEVENTGTSSNADMLL